MYKSYKIRLYPTQEQEELLWKHIHSCRFIWNYMLEYQENNYLNNGKYLNKYNLMKILTELKRCDDYTWLNEVSAYSLQNVCKQLDEAYKGFFNKIYGHPKYKSRKKSKLSYRLRNDTFHFNEDMTVTIDKFKKIKIKKRYNIVGKIISPTISYQNYKWILSFCIENENQILNTTDKSMGIDIGVKELAVVSYGEDKIVFHNINKSKRVRVLENKLKHINRVISRKYNTNGNHEKTKNILKYESMAKDICYKLSNIRHNYIHHVTHVLISLLPQIIVMENLDIKDMMNLKYLSKEIQDQCLYEFIRQMKYKCEWNGIQFIQADRYYPSSKTCSCCGNIKKNLKLSDRIYNCEKCGLTIDRDYNAAINLMKYASHFKGLTA